MVFRVAQVGAGAVGEQPPDAGEPAVARRDMQGQPPPLGISLVDRRPGRHQLIDDVQLLRVGGEPQRSHERAGGD